MRASNSRASSSEKALSSDSMGTPCSTGAKAAARVAPTLSDGEFSRTRCGKRASIAALRCFSASYSASETVGASSW